MGSKPYLPPPAYRSKWMSQIKGTNNLSTEILLLTLLRRHRITGWRRHLPITGRPDFLFVKKRVALFIDGDFWHGNPLVYKTPKTNSEFWDNKIRTNRARDRRVARALRKDGYKVIRIWESMLKKYPTRCLDRIKRTLKANQ